MKFFILLVICYTILSFEKCINSGQVSLTFDDSPSEKTKDIQRILDKYNIKGTFFINGYTVIKKNLQKTIKKLYDAGHIISSHSFSHVALEKINDFNIYREIYDNELIIRQIINKRPMYFRPPYFSYNDNIINILNKFGYVLILANIDTLDWKTPIKEDIINNVNIKLKSNDSFIILQHDNIINSIKAIEDIIKNVLNAGYKIVRMDECIQIPAYQNDNIYGLYNGF